MFKALTLSTALLLSACSTTKLVDHWQAEGFSRNDLNNVLVIAVTGNETSRFLFESEVERIMSKDQVKVTKSLTAMGQEYPTKEDVEAYVAKHDIDYVMASKLGNFDVEKTRIPPQVRTFYTGPYFPTYGAFYNSGNTVTLSREEFTDVRTTYMLVTTIFDAQSSEPVWIGRSETFEPSSVAELAAQIASSAMRKISR